jgi:eukaryotic-like serine/threonine-protein kinase
MVQIGHAREMNGREVEAPQRLSPGAHIGPYTLLSALGSGGAGFVWTAVRGGSLGFTQRTALKILRAERWANARAQRRFEREARVGSELRHPNIRAVYDLGHAGECAYMSMRWVDTSLAELLQHAAGHKLEPSIAAWVAIQCCAALDAAHGFVNLLGEAMPVVHQDVSPDNILLSAAGHVLLSDFAGAPERDPGRTPLLGSGKPEDAPPSSRPTFFGKLAYAAPEALQEAGVDARADVYALGCVLYEMLAGCPAFAANGEHALIVRVLQGAPTDIGELAPNAPPALLDIVRTCLSRDAAARFQSAEALRRALCSCVRHSGFELEEMTSDVIQETLGRRIEQREAELAQKLAQIAAAPGTRTESLPLAGGPRREHTSSEPAARAVSPLPQSTATFASQKLEEGGRAHSALPSTPTRGPVARGPVPRSAARAALIVGSVLALGASVTLGVWSTTRRDPAPAAAPASERLEHAPPRTPNTAPPPAPSVSPSPVGAAPAAPALPPAVPPPPNSTKAAKLKSTMPAAVGSTPVPTSALPANTATGPDRAAPSPATSAPAPNASGDAPRPIPKPASVRGIDDSNPY